jgi:hypothetical protein
VEKVEGIYKMNPAVEQIWVYGNSFESQLVAVVVPVAARLEAIGAAVGARGPAEELAKDERVKKELLAQLTATAKEGKLKVGRRRRAFTPSLAPALLRCATQLTPCQGTTPSLLLRALASAARPPCPPSTSLRPPPPPPPPLPAGL